MAAEFPPFFENIKEDMHSEMVTLYNIVESQPEYTEETAATVSQIVTELEKAIQTSDPGEALERLEKANSHVADVEGNLRTKDIFNHRVQPLHESIKRFNKLSK